MNIESRFVSDSFVTMTELVHPTHTNALNSVFGGVIMSWMDICGAIAAQRHSRRPVVTASIDAMSFVAPVYIGWIVNLKASINYVSKTSMEVGVRADAENPIEGKTFHVASAYLTFVALDKAGKPSIVPKIVPRSEDEKRRYAAAERRRQFRLKLREAETK